MHLAVIAAVFPLIFIGELPDKSMFASLLLASRGRPLTVWVGAASAFLIHVVIAVTIGVGVIHVLPRRAVEGFVALLFLIGAVFAFRDSKAAEEELVDNEVATHKRIAVTTFSVIFIAEWGDLTQILTANLAAHYRSALSVAVGATLALWAVAAIAVTSSQALLRLLPVNVIRKVTAAVLLVLAGVSAWAALR